MGREVITLQLGGFANYVGAHFWNFQDELLGLQEREEPRNPANQIDLSTVYRAGETLQGDATYTPRLVLLDQKGSLGGIGARGTLYLDAGVEAAAQAGITTWGGRAEVHRSHPVPRSRFMQQLEEEAEGEEIEPERDAASALDPALPSLLDTAAQELDAAGGVSYFTDFLKAHLHPRSIHQLEGVWAGVTEFGGWGDGSGLGGSWQETREGLGEAVRFFAEECDSLQGFQCLIDDLSGFGQLAADALQELRDEYGTRPVLLFAVRPSAAVPDASLSPAEARRHVLSNGLSHAVLSQRCDSYVALAPPRLHDGLHALRWQEGNLFHASAILAAAVDSATLPYRLDGGLGSAGGLVARETYVESLVLRGPQQGDKGAMPLSAAASALDAALVREAIRCVRQRTLSSQPLPIPLPYPHIFRPEVSVFGVPGRTLRPAAASVTSCPTLTRLAGTAAFKPAVQVLMRDFRRTAGTAQGQAALDGWGYSREELVEIHEQLAHLAAAYDEGVEAF
ncbi:hypothetical protein N2152v2_009219 [Parachlorella kessleri]